jgi:hypothetical protein
MISALSENNYLVIDNFISEDRANELYEHFIESSEQDDEFKKDTQCPTFTWASFADHAEDKIHPGVITHSNWAKILIKIWNL